MSRYDRVAVVIAVTLLAITCAVIIWTSTHEFTHREEHCRIEVYSDGSAEPICQPGWQPTQPIEDWPIVKVYG